MNSSSNTYFNTNKMWAQRHAHVSILNFTKIENFCVWLIAS